jgi:Na+/H+-dicarboxylate symporter
MGYIQIALSFAFFYIAIGNGHFVSEVTPIASIFFSFATIATVGYGDLSPTTSLAQLIVVLELVLGLFFVTIILAQVAGWATKSRREEGDYPIQDLQ